MEKNTENEMETLSSAEFQIKIHHNILQYTMIPDYTIIYDNLL